MEITTQKKVVDISTSKPTNVQVTPPSTIIEENAKTMYSQQQTIENQQELISEGIHGCYDELVDVAENQLPALAKKIDDIDLSSVENKVQEESAAIQAKIDNIQLPEIDTTELAKEATLNEVSRKLDNLNVDVDLSQVAKQGDNEEATNSVILSALNGIATNMYKGVVTIEHSGNATIAPNTYNIWGVVTDLTITKGTDVDGIVNSYMVRFTAGESATITFNGFALNWFGGSVPEWASGNTYEISIVDNIALWAEIEPTA